jgi:two-component system phosphate regulon sensor histidine kinase PhoR
MKGDRTVGGLLTRAFGALVVLIVCSGFAGVATAVVQHRTVQELTEHVQPLQLANVNMRVVLADAQRGLRGYLLTGDSALLDTYHVARGTYFIAERTMHDITHNSDDKAEAGSEELAITEQTDRANAWWVVAEKQRTAAPRSDEAAGYVAAGRPLFESFLLSNGQLAETLADRAAALKSRSSTLGWFTSLALSVLTVMAALIAALTAVRATRRITGPLGEIVAVLDRRRTGDLTARADATRGPGEIRAVAAAFNVKADESDLRLRQDQDINRLRTEVRELGYRIRTHLAVADAVREAVDGLATTLHADNVLLRMAPGQADVPPLASWQNRHADGTLAALAACPVDWLGSGDVWSTDDPVPVGDITPPDAERAAWTAAGAGPVATVALSNGDELLGAVTVLRDRDGQAWSPIEVRLVEVVAGDLGRGIHLARLYEREQQLVARLQELDTAKNDFMSTVSHELRTPLTSISGYLEMLRDEDAGAVTAAQDRMLDVIARNTVRLRALIEDLLLLSKIEGGTFRTERRTVVDVAVLVGNAVAAIAPVAAKASVGLHTDVCGPLELHGDADQIDRVLMNLLSNAVKFTPADGTVTVACRSEPGEMVLTVADTGMGIPQAEQQALFARFFRASNAVHQAIPGTGLGLAIVATIVDNHDGQIEVSSTEGVGTAVTVRFPTTA